MAESHGHEWRVDGISVLGAAHARCGLPNQDAMHWLPASGSGDRLCAAVADGHGSGKSFRSDIGARLAAELASKLLWEFLASCEGENLSTWKRTFEDRLPQELVRRWISLVEEHLVAQPFSSTELDHLEQTDGAKARQIVESRPLLAYGTTVVAAGIAPSFIVFLQLGDGDVLAVPERDGARRPLPRDGRLLGNETTSLCSPEAWRDVRCAFQVVGEHAPVLIALSTDGYANCFVSEADFLKVGSDLLEIVISGGLKLARRSLEVQLRDASRRYSGDDITIAVLASPAILTKSASQQREPATDLADHGTSST